MRRAFVSHSTADDSYVAEMDSFLRKAGFDAVFNDVRSIQPDEKFWPETEKGIAGCDAFVVVITAASNNSEWVKREVELARSLSKQIIPIWIEDSPIPSIFADRDVIDFRPRRRQERRFDISGIFKYAPAELIGREDETKFLTEAWQKTLRLGKGRPHVLTLVALGGEGKTALVAKWAAELAAQDWPGCAAASDLFLKEALNFFAEGDPEEEEIKAFAASAAGTFEKGQRLARLVGQQRSLLILDGLEPLQYAPTAPTPGELKDQGLAALLKGLAAASHSLCVVTTRYSLSDLKAFWKTTAPEVKLLCLSCDAGVHLLKSLSVRGTAQELATLVEEVKGHALTLTLLGSYLRDAHEGDIRKRDLVKLEDADAEEQGGHAFRVMAAYEQAFEDEGDKGQRALAILRLLGLFDRPMTIDCFDALRKGLAIPGLTEPLVNLADAQLNIAFTRLGSARLLTVNRDAAGALLSLDAHPLLREYFAKQLREQNPKAWRAGHKRLYEHLCETTKEGEQPTLEALQPLYQAVAHGCQAGLQHEACHDVYYLRILQEEEHYSMFKLGAVASDLGASACFFEQPWCQVSPSLTEADQAWLLNEAACCLGALGRLAESIEPMRTGLEMGLKLQNWRSTAIRARNLSELRLTLGGVVEAVGDAEQSLIYANRSGDAFRQIVTRTTLADALNQAGRRTEAETHFREAKHLQQVVQPDYPLLYSLWGFRYCELLISASEQAAWRFTLSSELRVESSGLIEECRTISQRVTQTLPLAEREKRLLDIALDHLTLGRAALYEAILESSALSLQPSALQHIDATMSGLRDAGQLQYLPLGHLTRAWCRAVTGDPAGTKADLDRAWEIAECGPMRLHMADIHLYRARLFFREQKYPWESPEVDLRAAEKLINDCSYHRRDEELADAKHAILGR